MLMEPSGSTLVQLRSKPAQTPTTRTHVLSRRLTASQGQVREGAALLVADLNQPLVELPGRSATQIGEANAR